jgi:enoyl-[acyl-carrier protein] reductase I
MSFKSDLMKGKKGLIMGVANDHSLAWGIADVLSKNSAELAFTYQGEAFLKRVEPLAESIGSEYILKCDVSNQEELEKVC